MEATSNMGILSQIILQGFAGDANFLTQAATDTIVKNVPFDPMLIIIGIVLIVITIFLIFFLKKIVVNSILGAIIWGLAVFVFGVKLPTVASFVIAVLFGPAGIGTLLVLSTLHLLVV